MSDQYVTESQLVAALTLIRTFEPEGTRPGGVQPRVTGLSVSCPPSKVTSASCGGLGSIRHWAGGRCALPPYSPTKRVSSGLSIQRQA